MLPSYWGALARTFTFRDKFIVTILLVVALAATLFLGRTAYLGFTVALPKTGGEYVEGVVGQPLYVNPLLSQTSDADADLARVIYSGLFTYNKEGKAVPDIAQDYAISEDSKTYTVYLRQNVKWHDGEALTAEDVVFTFKALQDPAYKSPLRQLWQGVEVSSSDDYTVVFALKAPYFAFLDNLTVGILPRHIWENISPEKFALAEYNLRPVGTGPYRFVDFQKDSSGTILSYSLQANETYYRGVPYISRFTFNFYPDEDSLLAAYNKKEVAGMGSVSAEKLGLIKSPKSMAIHEMVVPRYFAAFFNQTHNAALAFDEVRRALAKSVDRDEIVSSVLGGKGTPLASPLFPQMKEYTDISGAADFSPEEANRILDETGWTRAQDSIRSKGNTRLSFELVTADWPELRRNADLLAAQWQKIGAEVRVTAVPVVELQQNYIRTREYDSILFGQAISFNPDLYPFWHSSNKRDPGLNLALFEDKEADTLLEEIRQEPSRDERIKKIRRVQEILSAKNPAVFLYGPSYLHVSRSSVSGISAMYVSNGAQRLADVHTWFVKVRRVLKEKTPAQQEEGK